MEVPSYIATLVQPLPAKAPKGRKVWSIDLQTVWVPFFTATNTVKATALPSEALGAPLRLAYDKDGEVKFTKSGLPALKVAPELAEQVRVVRENFTASLMSYTHDVAQKAKDAYKAEMEAARKAGQPILDRMESELTEAMARLYEAEAKKVAEVATPPSELVAVAS